MENSEISKIQEALQVIELGINKATEKGAYNLTEVYQLINALTNLKQKLLTQQPKNGI
jgi:hypothetical protein